MLTLCAIALTAVGGPPEEGKALQSREAGHGCSRRHHVITSSLAASAANRKEPLVPYATETIRLIVKGTILNTQDWSCGFAFSRDNALNNMTYEELTAWLEDVKTDVGTWFTAIASVRSQRVSFTDLRAEYYTGGERAALIAQTAAPSTTAGTTAAVQSARGALVVSLLTNKPGRSYRGRVYVPALGVGLVELTGRVGAASQTTLLNATKTMLNAIAAKQAGGFPVRPIVASKTTASKTTVASLRCDDLLDTQRRRENDFQPSYTTIAL